MNIFDMIERRSRTGFFPLNENHWSNVLAFLLDPSNPNGAARPLLGSMVPTMAHDLSWTLEREVVYDLKDRSRLIDLQLTLSSGARCFVEVKIDPGYKDPLQIADQISLLKDGDFYLLIAPYDLSEFVTGLSGLYSGVVTQAVSWRAIAAMCQNMVGAATFDALTNAALSGTAEYWSRTIETPFADMARTILAENGWTNFYPDDFKAAFLARFPEVWAAWTAEKPTSGNGNPHQYLLTCLAMLANRRSGFRLQRTGNTRAPSHSGWGYPKIFELTIVEN